LGLIGGLIRRRRKRSVSERNVLPDLATLRMSALMPETGSLIGTVIDSRFTPRRLIARGGFATVFDGYDSQERRRCAIKVFHRQVAEKGLIKRFEQEVTALQTINHPNVVRLYAHGMAPSGVPYLVMEFVEGTTLRDALPPGGFPPRQVATLLRQIGSALGALHSHRIYHRDLKPENLMIRSASPSNQDLVLIDFSIAIVKNPDESMHGLSRAAGTFLYMAPEQVMGHASNASDIYSLAKVVVEMMTGKPMSELLPDASIDLPSRIGEVLAALPFTLSPDSAKLIGAALEFDPARRPTNAVTFSSQIAKDLEHPGITG
jgi:serine/threonine protein kinase